MKSIHELLSLKNRVAVVTGGAGYIGSTISETMAELGASVVILDIEEKESLSLAKKMRQNYSVDTMALSIDLSKENDIKQIPHIVLEKFGRMDILINNAAMTAKSQPEGWIVPFEEQTLEAWNKAMAINLTAIFLLAQASKEVLEESNHGSIINIASIYGSVGPDMSLYEDLSFLNPAAYAASKGGVIQLTRWLSAVLAPKIRVNALSPGGVFQDHRDPFLSRYNKRTPLQRMATREDLKGGIAYLASDLSQYVTGQNLVIDGGWSIK